MDFFKDLPRQLLNNNKVANQLFKSGAAEEDMNGEDADYFFNLAIRKTTTQMSYLEQNRVNHLLLKNAFESFQ